MKKHNEKKAATIVNKLLKETRKTGQMALWNVWTDEQGRTCALDVHRAYRLNSRPAGVEDKHDFDGNAIKQPATNLAERAISAFEFDARIELPDADAIKAWKKAGYGAVTVNGKKGSLFPVFAGGAEMIYNADNLLDLVELFPGAAAFVSGAKGGLSPIYVKSENGDGILLPVRTFDATRINDEWKAFTETAEKSDVENVLKVAEQPAAEQVTEEAPEQAADVVTVEQPAPVAVAENAPAVETVYNSDSAPVVNEKEQAYLNAIGTAIKKAGYTIIFDTVLSRVRVTIKDGFDGLYKNLVEQAGFWYSPTQHSYNKRLNRRGYTAAMELVKVLDGAAA